MTFKSFLRITLFLKLLIDFFILNFHKKFYEFNFHINCGEKKGFLKELNFQNHKLLKASTFK